MSKSLALGKVNVKVVGLWLALGKVSVKVVGLWLALFKVRAIVLRLIRKMATFNYSTLYTQLTGI